MRHSPQSNDGRPPRPPSPAASPLVAAWIVITVAILAQTAVIAGLTPLFRETPLCVFLLAFPVAMVVGFFAARRVVFHVKPESRPVSAPAGPHPPASSPGQKRGKPLEEAGHGWSGEFFRDIVEHLPDIILRHDRELRYAYVNPGAGEPLGVDPAGMIGKSCRDVGLLDELCRMCEDRLRLILATGEPQEMDITLGTRPCEAAHYNWRAVPEFGPGGEVVSVLVIARDETARKQVSEQRIRGHKLELAGVLVGGIAHDFNNLLMGIMGALALARLRAAGQEEILRLLAEAEKSSLRARDLIQKFITFSEGGRPVRKTVDLAAVLREAALAIPRDEGIEVFIGVPEDLFPLSLDMTQVVQAFHFILTNAREAMPSGGRVTLTAENTLLQARDLPAPEHPTGDYVRVTVQDTGAGIRPEHLSRVFDPYFSTKDRGERKGMGLGLSIAYSIIRKHGGFITVESEPGRGTGLHVFLPSIPEWREDGTTPSY